MGSVESTGEFSVSEMAVVEYRHHPNEGIQEVLYTNAYYNEIFGEIDSEDPIFPHTQLNSSTDHTVNEEQHTSITTEKNMELGGDLVDISQWIVKISFDGEEKTYECIRADIDTNKSINMYMNKTKVNDAEKFVSILQRIVRHNIRNDMNIAIGLAQNILDEDSTTPEIKTNARRIINVCSELSEVSQKVSTIDAIRKGDQSLTPADVVSITNSVISKHRSTNQDTHIKLDVETTQTTVLATDQVSVLIDNLVENAIEHNSGDIIVEVSIRDAKSESILLSISDNGPGIADMEKNVVTGEQPIEKLYHASSLGLWVVRWVVDQHDANIEFEESRFGGTKVNVILPTKIA